MRVLAVLRALAVGHRTRGDIRLHADERLYAFLLAGLIKIDHAVHHAVIGNRQRGLPCGLGAANQIGNARRSVEKAKLRVNMQMRKLSHAVSPLRCG
ncbi:hypothetical protein SDC9_89509 [bioreactor metagenome]|uniref:Uncharacterized protein n=1 Tax=bioreactor metagenome TaxID=1076179 RepID=A0A644ZQ09_9ZZZZ